MRRYIRMLSFLAALPAGLAGQAIVEHAVISGGTAAGAASARNAAKSIGGALRKLDGVAGEAAKSGSGAVTPVSAPSPPAAPVAQAKSAKAFEDAGGIKTGLAYSELLRRFGEPAMRISGGGAEQTLIYTRKDGGMAQVRVSGGQVAAVE